MAIAVEIVIPWQFGCAHRERALGWVLDRWAATRPDWLVTVAMTQNLGQWVKADTWNPTVRCSTADVVVMHDADVWCEGTEAAVDKVLAGAPWAIPHRHVFRFTEESTGRFFAGAAPDRLQLDEPPYIGVRSGGICVLRRDVAEDVPMDPRFRGWGGEDHAWGVALSTLYGEPERATHPLRHLWHPPPERMNRKIGSQASEALRTRYFRASGHAPSIRSLIEEIEWPTKSSPSTRSSSTGQGSRATSFSTRR